MRISPAGAIGGMMPITKATRHVKELEAENAKLRALIQRVNQSAKYLFDEWGGVDNKVKQVRQSPYLKELLKDCREAMAIAEERGE